jgi:hypothetical protein
MPLEVDYKSGDGTTIPYGPIFDGVRKNRGFVDARGRPDIAAIIAEGSESAALKALLVRIAEENVLPFIGVRSRHAHRAGSKAGAALCRRRLCSGGRYRLSAFDDYAVRQFQQSN